MQEYSADNIKQMKFSDAGFLGNLRVEENGYNFRGGNSDKLFCLFSGKGSNLKGQNLSQVGASSSLLE